MFFVSSPIIKILANIFSGKDFIKKLLKNGDGVMIFGILKNKDKYVLKNDFWMLSIYYSDKLGN